MFLPNAIVLLSEATALVPTAIASDLLAFAPLPIAVAPVSDATVVLPIAILASLLARAAAPRATE